MARLPLASIGLKKRLWAIVVLVGAYLFYIALGDLIPQNLDEMAKLESLSPVDHPLESSLKRLINKRPFFKSFHPLSMHMCNPQGTLGIT